MNGVSRKVVIAAIQYAGYHDDTAKGTRLMIEHHISAATYQAAFHVGRMMRGAGFRCGCDECKTKTAEERKT